MRFQVVISGVLALWVFSFPDTTNARQEKRPNILLLLADDLGYGDVSAYGSRSIPTPHIDQLSREGVRFTDAYVTDASCSPSRAGLITGCYQQRFGFEFNTGPAAITEKQARGLDPSATTMADALKQEGYTTGVMGKWHLGTRDKFQPTERGFDEFFGFLAGAHAYFPSTENEPVHSSILRGKEKVKEPEYLTDAFAREAVAFIEKHHQEPFFLYVPFNAVHTPIQATEKYKQRFSHVENKGQRTYNAMVSALDEAIGSILNVLKKHRLEKNTLVVFLNDNGGPLYTGVQSNGPLRLGKGFLFEGGVRVPMIIRWPDVLPSNTAYSNPVMSLDLFPTFCAAAGVELSHLDLDGVDLLPFLREQKTGDPHKHLFWRNGTNRAVRAGKWKMIKARDHVWLFDLSGDIGERENVAKEHPDVVESLEKALELWKSRMKPPAWPSRHLTSDYEVEGVEMIDGGYLIDGVKYEIYI